MAAKATQLKTDKPIGRMSALGIASPGEVSLLLPRTYLDLRGWAFHEDFTRLPIGGKAVVKCVSVEDIRTHFDRRPSRTVIRLLDGKGNALTAAVFGDSRNLLARIKPKSLFFLQGTVGVWNECTQLASPVFIRARDIGSVMPVYPGKEGVISTETLRERVGGHLETSIPVWLERDRQMAGYT